MISKERISRDYLQKYCSTEINFVKFPRSNVVKKFTTVKHRFSKDELINLAVDKKLYCQEDKKSLTFIEKFDLCFEKNLIEENEILNQYRENDLRELINRKNKCRLGGIISGKLLFTKDWDYLLNSNQNVFNLRNLCIQKGIISDKEFGKIPEACNFYEDKLIYIPIRRDMKNYVKLDALYNGWDKRGDSTYFEFFNMENYPEEFRNYIRMQERNLVNAFNMEMDEHYNSVVENIEYMVNNRDEYSDQNIINEYFLKIKHPEALQEIFYDGKFDDPIKIKLKVDEILKI